MPRTIAEWQKAAHALAVEKCFHSWECPKCHGYPDPLYICSKCSDTGRIPVDPFSPIRIGACLAAIHAEISEAYECVARGRMDTHYVIAGRVVPLSEVQRIEGFQFANRKPEGFPIELADVFLRLCDLAESLGVRLELCEPELSDEFDGSPEHCAAALNQLHNTVSNINVFDVDQNHLQVVLQDLTSIAQACNVDLLAMAELKHEYNRTRPIRHGKIL